MLDGAFTFDDPEMEAVHWYSPHQLSEIKLSNSISEIISRRSYNFELHAQRVRIAEMQAMSVIRPAGRL